MRLAILDADILREALRPRYHSYGRMFVELFRGIGVAWEMDSYSVISGQYPANHDEYDAFLITGSQHDAFGDADWVRRLGAYVRALYREGKPLVGICFGHQLLAHALGGKAGRAEAGWGLGVMAYGVEALPDFADSLEPVELLVSHRDQVVRLPAEAELLLANDFCPLAGFYIPSRLLAIQGHPEFSVAYARALLACRTGEIAPEQRSRIERSFSVPHQGERIAHWLRRFLDGAVRAA